MSEWVSVKDRLPEKENNYLVYMKHGYMKILSFSKNMHEIEPYSFLKGEAGWFDYDSEYGAFMRNDVAFWRELPEPPKEE